MTEENEFYFQLYFSGGVADCVSVGGGVWGGVFHCCAAVFGEPGDKRGGVVQAGNGVLLLRGAWGGVP